jgi:glutamate carboxypeptidase
MIGRSLYLPVMVPGTLLDIARGRADSYVDSLREMVNIDSGSYTPEGVNRIADLCESRFRAGGWDVERRPHHAGEGAPEQLGDLVIGRRRARGMGDGGAAAPRILMIGHMDTVFPDGTAAERPFRVEGDHARGPGVSDMKGGLLIGFLAVEVLDEADLGGDLGLTYVCNPDEEIGSPFSGPVIKELARSADAAFVMEAARENGDVVSARKGVTDFRIDIRGRAAHAGVEPEKGRSAILEAAKKTLALQELNGRWPGVTVNVGVIEGGTRSNVIAERCRLKVDVRSSAEESLQAVEAEVKRIGEMSAVPDVACTVEAGSWHRPFEKKGGSALLAAEAIRIAGDLGFELHDAATGGASDANTTSAAGVSTLDGLGPVGGDDHAPSEWSDLPSVPMRIALLSELLSRAGAVVGG